MIWLANNWIALFSLVIAAISLVVAFRSNQKSIRAEARATETNHVSLDLDLDPSDGALILTNNGSGTALDLQGIITADDESQAVHVASLGPNADLKVVFPDLRDEYLDYSGTPRSTDPIEAAIRHNQEMYTYGWDLVWKTPAGNVGKSNYSGSAFYPEVD